MVISTLPFVFYWLKFWKNIYPRPVILKLTVIQSKMWPQMKNNGKLTWTLRSEKKNTQFYWRKHLLLELLLRRLLLRLKVFERNSRHMGYITNMHNSIQFRGNGLVSCGNRLVQSQNLRGTPLQERVAWCQDAKIIQVGLRPLAWAPPPMAGECHWKCHEIRFPINFAEQPNMTFKHHSQLINHWTIDLQLIHCYGG